MALQLPAQGLRIVKDNINCTYGLKDEAGAWVLKAKYTLIQTTNTGYYLLWLDSQQGIADRKGKVLIKPTYDRISSFPNGKHIQWYPGKASISFDQVPVNHLFLVYKGNFKGLVHKTGKVLFRAEYEQVVVDKLPNIILYKQSEGIYTATLADTSGRLFIPKVKGYLRPFNGSPIAIVWDGHSSQKNPWAIDRMGKTVIEKGYERLYYDNKHQRIMAVNNGVRTDFDLRGKVIPTLVEQKPKYQLYWRSWNGNESLKDLNHALRNHTHIIIDENRNFGLYRNGEVTLETAYSFIDDEDPGSKDFEFLLRKDRKWGTASFVGAHTIPAQYDTLIPQQLLWKNQAHSENQRYSFIASKNGKYGLIGEKEEVFEPLENDHYLGNMGSHGTRFAYFSRSIKVKGYDLNTYPPEKKSITFVARHDSLVLFKQDELILPFVAHPDRSYQLYKSIQAKYHGSFCAFSLGGKSCLVQPDGSLFMEKTMASYREFDSDFLAVQTSSGLSGLVDVKTRRFVIDPIYKEFDHSFSKSPWIWARKEGPYLPEQGYGCGYWHLLNINGAELSDKNFSKPFPLYVKNAFVGSNGLVGLMDVKTMQWILAPVFADFMKLADGIYVSVTPSGSMGLIRQDGRLIEDTLYDQIVQVYQAAYMPNADSDRDNIWFELQNGDQVILLSDRGQKVEDAATILKMKKEFAFYPMSADDNPGSVWGKGYQRNSCHQCLHIGVDSLQWGTFENEPFRDRIYETAIDIFKSYKPCLSVRRGIVPCLKVKSNCQPQGNLKSFQLEYLDEYGFSLLNWYTVGSDRLGMPVIPYYELVRQWSNFVLVNGELQQIKRVDIFGTGNLLYDEFVKAVKKRDDLDLKCGTVSEVELVVGERFSLSKEGVLLHLNQSIRSWDKKAEVLIPWANLAQRKESKEIAALFL